MFGHHVGWVTLTLVGQQRKVLLAQTEGFLRPGIKEPGVTEQVSRRPLDGPHSLPAVCELSAPKDSGCITGAGLCHKVCPAYRGMDREEIRSEGGVPDQRLGTN